MPDPQDADYHSPQFCGCMDQVDCLFESALAPETSTNPTGNIDLSTVLSSSEPVMKLDSDSARALSVDLPNTGEVPVLLPWARRLNLNKRCR